MTLLLSDLGSRLDLPPVVERLLLDVVTDGFTVYCCGPRAAPTTLAASYDWEDCVDHITIRGWDRVTAARFPKLGRVDAPEIVSWAYEGPAECTLRAAQPGAPAALGRPRGGLPGAPIPAGTPA